jgi:branched-chain amino acid aminotransferase
MSSIIVYRASGDALECLPIHASSLDEATLLTGHGVYTVFRLYPGRRVFRLAGHFERLRHSAELLGMSFYLADDWLRHALRHAVEESGLDLVRIRLTVPFDASDTAVIVLEPFTPPLPSLYEEGIRIGLIEGVREAPLAKNSQFVEWRQKVRAASPIKTHEIVLHDSGGAILEGLSSNFYAVLDGQLRTAGDKVLEGISRSVLLDVAPSVLPVMLSPIVVADLPRVSEAMLTSASRGVMSVVQVGGVVLGGGKPGPMAKALRAAYDAQVERELEPL